MRFKPRLPVRHGRSHFRQRLTLGLFSLCVAACTEPSFLSLDASDRVERGDADLDGSESDGRDDERELDASSAPAPDAEACDDCKADAEAAGAEANLHDAQLARSDAQAAEAQVAPSDAQAATPDAQLDPVRATWAGRYAARSWVFAHSTWMSNPINTYARYLTLVQIKPSADGGLVLEEEICFFDAAFTLIYTAHFDVTYPAGTRLSAPLVFGADHFSSISAAAQIGYGPPPADCAGAASSRSSTPVRPWLTDNVCECPDDLTAQPTSAKDCRVYDSDGDGFPGNTFRTSLDDGTKGVARVTQEQRLRLLNGYRSGDRLYAQRQFSDATSVLSCTVNERPARIEDCALGSEGACPAAYNPVELYRIEDKYGCSDIIQREQGWFLSARPEFPVGCQVQTAQR
jgi:hypothetical protein